jgi:hypothetical protein
VRAPHRSFDPNRLGRLETDAWVTYYLRDWPRFLRAAVGLTRHAFGLPWPQTLYGAWLVLRANQQWAPRDNDPAGARRTMQRFYALLERRYREGADPARAAELEVEWWRVHRDHQHSDDPDADEAPLIEALTSLYSYLYRVPAEDVRRAAEQRALAMRYSDRWVNGGCLADSPLVGEERAALVRSYAALLSAVHQP